MTPLLFSHRRNKVSIAQFGEVLERPPAVEPLIGALPDILAAADLRAIVDRWAEAVRGGRAVVMCGGHVVKTGCSLFLPTRSTAAGSPTWRSTARPRSTTSRSPLRRDLEDVAKNLADGTFGLADETGAWMAEAVAQGHAEDLGCGRSAAGSRAGTLPSLTRARA